MKAAVLVLVVLLFGEGSILVLMPGLVKRLIPTVPERTLQVIGFIETVLALILLVLLLR